MRQEDGATVRCCTVPVSLLPVCLPELHQRPPAPPPVCLSALRPSTCLSLRPSRRHGEPGHGGADPAGQQAAGRVRLHRAELEPGPAADRGGGRAERREELGAGELRGPVSTGLSDHLSV